MSEEQLADNSEDLNERAENLGATAIAEHIATELDSARKIHEEWPSISPREFEFHQQRYREISERFNDRGILKKLIDWRRGTSWNAQMTPVDAAHQEALRDNADFDRRQSEEYQAWQRNLQVVVDHIIEKRDHTAEEGKEIKTLLLILGGGMKGPYSAGQVLGLNEVGLNKAFDTVVGISAGAGTAAFFTAGEDQTRIGASIFYEEATTPNFVNLRRVRRIMDVDFIIDKFRRGEKAIDQQAIMSSPTELYVGVTRPEDLESELINAKTAKPDMLSALHASMAAPIAYRKAIEVNEENYIDGAFDPMPIQRIIDQFNPTDVLILPNTPFDKLDAFEASPGEIFVSGLLESTSKLLPVASLGTVEKFLRLKQQIRRSLEFIQKEEGVNIGILWPPDSGLTNVTTDSTRTEAAVLESARDAIKAFGGKQPSDLNLYHHQE